MAAEITEDWLAQQGLALVYYSRGRMAHLIPAGSADGHPINTDGPLCDRVPWWKVPFGTGDQDEWERARALPLCPACAKYGPCE